MLMLNITSSGKEEMFVSFQSGSVGFTITNEKQQFDFSIDENEWEQLKFFIDDTIKREKNK